MKSTARIICRWHAKQIISFSLCLLLGVVLTYYMTQLLFVSNRPVSTNAIIRKSNTSLDSFPRYFHQIWLNYTKMPKRWDYMIRSSIKINKDIVYKLWSNHDVEDLLSREYPWFLRTYREYAYPVQRTDAARYFILLSYGGLYMDMDIRTKVDFLHIIEKQRASKHDCVVPQTAPFGVSNDVMMCKAGSPFMEYVTSQLRDYNRWYVLPFLTIMLSTGPLFLTRVLSTYYSPESVYILPHELYTSVYFQHVKGSTWHTWDAKLLTRLYYEPYTIIPRGVASIFLLLVMCVFICLVCFKCKRFKYIMNFSK